VHDGQTVLMKVDGVILLIVGDPQGILYKQVKPQPNRLLNVIMI
jgi:hypothetical protein